MINLPPGYGAADVEQHRLASVVEASDVDPRSPFMHDRDRILYASAFGSLAGKTQVVASGESGGFHTRLTHSLKVAQLGRRIAEMLTRPDRTPGPDPDLVEAACLAHDIGHPPFGHAGEGALSRTYHELLKESEPDSAEGFEGNAQNLRILTYLASRKTQRHRGLHLTRAALDATMKYPWSAGAEGTGGKFGIYAEDKAAAEWIGPHNPERPVEEEIMDWADNVTYACHDVEDFYRAGLIPLHLLLEFPPPDRFERRQLTPSPELERFLEDVERRWARKRKPYDRDRAINHFYEISNFHRVYGPFLGLHADKVLLTSMTSQLISFFLEGIRLEPRGSSASDALTRYAAHLAVPQAKQEACDLLKELIWFYVINRPELASQQHGQARIVSDLLRWHNEEPDRLLPADRREEYREHGNALRASCDHVASLTEQQALILHRRMSGAEIGSIMERLA